MKRPSENRIRRWQVLRVALKHAITEEMVKSRSSMGLSELRCRSRRGNLLPRELGLPWGVRRNARGTATRRLKGQADLTRSPWRSEVVPKFLRWLATAWCCGCDLVVGSVNTWADLLCCSCRSVSRALAELDAARRADPSGADWLIIHYRFVWVVGGRTPGGHWDQVPSAYEIGPRLREWLEGRGVTRFHAVGNTPGSFQDPGSPVRLPRRPVKRPRSGKVGSPRAARPDIPGAVPAPSPHAKPSPAFPCHLAPTAHTGRALEGRPSPSAVAGDNRTGPARLLAYEWRPEERAQAIAELLRAVTR